MEKCPLCGSKIVYMGATTLECAGEDCCNFREETEPHNQWVDSLHPIGSFLWARDAFVQGWFLEEKVDHKWCNGYGNTRMPNRDDGNVWRVTHHELPMRVGPEWWKL